ncbi:unnamed protein product, partial [Closterium sp. NIES-54]
AHCACRRVAPAVPSRPVAHAVPSRRPCRRVALAVPSHPVAPAVPLTLLSRPVAPAILSPLLSLRVAPCCPVMLRLSLLTRRVAPSVPSRPVHAALLVLSRRTHPVRPARPSHPLCALPVRRAPAAPCPSVAPHAPYPSVAPRAPCPSVAPPLRPARPSRPVPPACPRLSRASLPVASCPVASHCARDSWAHASGDLPEPADPAPLAADPTPANSDRYARERADVTAWKSRDAAACIALSSLLLEFEETHITQVRTASEFLTAIKARYVTPTTVSLGRLFLPFLFPHLASFERTADLITHLRSLDSSYRAACTDAQLALLPPPMTITTYFIATSLPDHLASIRVTGGVVRVRAEAAEAVGVTWRAAAARVQGLEERLVQRPVTPLLQLVVVMPGFVSHQPTYGPALWGISASKLVNLLGTPQAMYGVVDSSASDSVYSSVVSSGASLAEVHVASVGTCVDTSPGAAPEDASLSFILDSGASHCFFRDRTTLTPLPTPVSVALADPTSGPVTARYTTTLPCQAVLSDSLTGFRARLFSRNLVGVRPLVSQHVGVWIEPSGETAVRVSGPVAASCSCRSLAHPTVLWHHRMGHPSISRLPAMSSQSLVLGLPHVLPSLPPSLAPPCGPFVEGRLRATPHSSSLRPTTEPFETLHLDVWGPASRPGFERESFFLVVVDDYSRYTIVLPLAKKSDVNSTLIRWLLTTADTCGRRVSCLHSDRGGLVMEIARTSMTHAHAPHFLWPYAVRYAPHQLNLWPRVSRPEVSPTSLWTGSPCDVSRFRVWGCLALVRDTSADKILPRVVPCVFLGFPEDSSNYTFYHPPLHRFFDSRDVRFKELVPYYVRCSLLPRSPPPSLQQTLWEPVFMARTLEVLALEVLELEQRAGAFPGGATTGGAPSAGPGEPGTDPVAFGGAGSGCGATGSLESGPGATTAPNNTPPHPYPTRHQARQQQPPQPEEQRSQLQQEQQQHPPPPPVSGLWTLGLPSPLVSGPPFPPLHPSPAVFPPPLPSFSPPLSHTWLLSRSPSARPSSHVPFTDLRTALFRSSPPRSSPSILPSSPESALTASLYTPATDYYRTYRLVLSRVLASLVSDPRASLSFVSALTAAVTEFASTRCLDYATTASPHLCAMLLGPEGDPDALDIPTPRIYAEAVSGPWASQWIAPMDSEMASYRSTYTYVDEVPSLGANVVDGMWIFRVKRPPGSPPFFKACYVARGFSQREGPSSADPSLFFHRGSTPFFVLVYVDDLFFATADRVALADMKLELQKRHTCTDLGELRHYLGLRITRDRAARTVTLSQSHMVQQVLQLFELQHSTVQRTPLAVDHRLTGPFPDKPFEPSGSYAELVGCLMYLMTCTRPDLAFPLCILACFVAPERHRPVHWSAAVRVTKYLATTSGMGLVLGGRHDVVLTGHCDSSYADDAETHRSTQGYCFSLGSGVVSWRSTRSSSVSTSTVEAKIYARAMAVQELCWLRSCSVTLVSGRALPRPCSLITRQRFSSVESRDWRAH